MLLGGSTLLSKRKKYMHIFNELNANNIHSIVHSAQAQILQHHQKSIENNLAWRTLTEC